MNILFHAIASAALMVLPVISAVASQGPGTSGGTATGLEKSIFVGAIVAAVCIGLIFKLRHH